MIVLSDVRIKLLKVWNRAVLKPNVIPAFVDVYDGFKNLVLCLEIDDLSIISHVIFKLNYLCEVGIDKLKAVRSMIDESTFCFLRYTLGRIQGTLRNYVFSNDTGIELPNRYMDLAGCIDVIFKHLVRVELFDWKKDFPEVEDNPEYHKRHFKNWARDNLDDDDLETDFDYVLMY